MPQLTRRRAAAAAVCTLAPSAAFSIGQTRPPCLRCGAAETERKECPDTPATRSLQTAFSLLDFAGLQGAGDGQGAIV